MKLWLTEHPNSPRFNETQHVACNRFNINQLHPTASVDFNKAQNPPWAQGVGGSNPLAPTNFPSNFSLADFERHLPSLITFRDCVMAALYPPSRLKAKRMGHPSLDEW